MGAQRQITLNFDEKLLGMDAVQVWPTMPDTEGLAMVTMYNCLNGTCFSSCGTDSRCVERCAAVRWRCRGPAQLAETRCSGLHALQIRSGHITAGGSAQWHHLDAGFNIIGRWWLRSIAP